MTIDLSSKVGPYTGVTRDELKTLKDGRTFRIVLYGAYNAMGLIGSEYNGIVILSEDQKNIVADDIARESSGYFGPSDRQRETFEALIEADDQTFKTMVNSADKLRYEI